MEVVTFENSNDYVSTLYIKEHAPKYFAGSRNGKELIRNKGIDENEYIFARLKSDGYWYVSDGKSCQLDKVFLRKSFVESDDDLMAELNGEVSDDTPEAPEIIDLEEHEMFHDDEGNVVEIETRGERDCDKIFFRMIHVMEAFEMPNLYYNMQNKLTLYEEGRDYVFFMCTRQYKVQKKQVRTMFVTYMGLTKVLFKSRSGIAYKFASWAIKIIFTVHMGTDDQKNELIGKIKEVDASVVKEVFSKTSQDVSCIYLLKLGSVQDLRKTFNIPASFKYSDGFYKMGMTNDLSKRMAQHKATYGKMKNVKVVLTHYEYIDPQYKSDAERKIKNFFEVSNMFFQYENHVELVIISTKNYKKVIESFETIGQAYAGHISKMVERLKEKDKEMEIALLKKDNEINMLKKDHEILKKDNEILMIKNEVLKNEVDRLKRKLRNKTD